MNQPMLASMSAILMRAACLVRLMIVVLMCCVALPSISVADDSGASQPVQAFVQSHCYDCHSGTAPEAGLDLESLTFDLSSHDDQRTWVRIFDRVESGEMPPAEDWGEADPQQRDAFLKYTSGEIKKVQQHESRALGRVPARRLTRLQIERSLHDLLGIDIPLVHLLPEDPRTDGFTTVAEGQDISLFHLQAQLEAVDVALDEAFRRAGSENELLHRDLPATEFVRTNPRRRCREPELLDGQAVVWNAGVTYYGRIPATTAPRDGWYAFELMVGGLNLPQTGGVWCTVRTGKCISSAPLLQDVTIFEAAEEPKTVKFTAWLPKGHMLEIRPADKTLKSGRFKGGQVGAGEGGPQNVPGIAMDHLSMRQIRRNGDDAQIRHLLFGDLPITSKNSKNRRSEEFQVVSKSPKEDVTRLMTTFAARAFRRPVESKEIEPYTSYVHQMLDDDASFLESLRAGYRALLCSPRFLYFQEQPGKLDQYAVATRLSYLLTGSFPDDALMQAAANQQLSDRKVIRTHVRRLLEGESGEQFLTDFASQWLDLAEIDETQPDRRLYPQFDAVVQQSMRRETIEYLVAMLQENSSVTQLIDSDHTFLNSRLARHYEIEGVTGDAMRRIQLSETENRGGLMTQGAILKVTADGTNTSPVLRGAWIGERLLGLEIPPPPANVPAVEPDVRGATTIREQLEKHRSSTQCASCHSKMDPAGFALENFDPTGRWRENYYINPKKKGPAIDASYQLDSGESFEDVNSFQELIVRQPEQLAENVAKKLIVYGTGAPVRFVDRESIDRIVSASSDSNYGLKTIIEEVVTSDLFLSK